LRRSKWVPRVLLGLGGLALLAAIVSISVGERGSGKTVPEGLDEVQRLIAGIPQEGNRLGDEDAPVAITVFTDLLCHECSAYQLETIDPLIEEYARRGEAAFELRHVAITGRDTTLPALAATAAGEQGRQWQYAGLFARNAGATGQEVKDELLREIADATPDLVLEQWEEDRASAEVEEIVAADSDLANELELTAPSVVVDGPGGTKQLEDSPSAGEIREAVTEVGRTGQ
jgi:protein-disulfide isomerase